MKPTQSPFRIFHTADWHLGARLMERSRLEEQKLFLDWLLQEIRQQQPHLLLIAGDVFDSTNPPQESLSLYYQFLHAFTSLHWKPHVVITGGNHDSPALLNAPATLLKSLNVHVIGSLPQTLEETILELDQVIIAAVPYLRERDVRTPGAGENPEEISRSIKLGIQSIYQELKKRADALNRKNISLDYSPKPILAMGHLTAFGTTQSESERSIHIGNLESIGTEAFTDFDYTALGHLHHPQCVGKNENIRYSGSPIPLSFSEVSMRSEHIQNPNDLTPFQKEIREIVIHENGLNHRAIPIPTFRRMHRLSTTFASLESALKNLEAKSKELIPWIELTLTDAKEHVDLQSKVHAISDPLRVEVLKILDPEFRTQFMMAYSENELLPSLSNLDPKEVFRKKLETVDIAPDSEQGKGLQFTFRQLLEHHEESKRIPAESPGKPSRKSTRSHTRFA